MAVRKFKLTAEEYFAERQSGKTIAQIAKEQGVSEATIYNHMDKWAKEGKKSEPSTGKPMLREKSVRPNDTVKAEVYQQTSEMLQQEINNLQEELKSVREINLAAQADYDRLLQERDDFKRTAEELEDSAANHDQIVEMLNKAKSRLNELEKENGNLLFKMSLLESGSERKLEPVEYFGPEPAPVDYVNHPPHYIRGGIECIDAIEAATVGLEGPEAYSTGAAIKYLWRWKWKNGTEDLQKANWYIDRLIEGAKA